MVSPDRNPFLWRFVNQGERWWRDLVNRRGDDGLPLFIQPAEAGDKVELMPSVQPVFIYDPSQFDRNPSLKGLIVASNRLYQYKGDATSNTDRHSLPLLDRSPINSHIGGLGSTPNTQLLGQIVSFQATAFKNSGGEPDYDTPATNWIGVQLNVAARVPQITFAPQSGYQFTLPSEFSTWPGNYTSQFTPQFVTWRSPDRLLPIGSGGDASKAPPSFDFGLRAANNSNFFFTDDWITLSLVAVFFALDGVLPDGVKESPSLVQSASSTFGS